MRREALLRPAALVGSIARKAEAPARETRLRANVRRLMRGRQFESYVLEPAPRLLALPAPTDMRRRGSSLWFRDRTQARVRHDL